ncbi:hypothetical protein AB1N83_009670 [Pleurotus pulmonarius]
MLRFTTSPTAIPRFYQKRENVSETLIGSLSRRPTNSMPIPQMLGASGSLLESSDRVKNTTWELWVGGRAVMLTEASSRGRGQSPKYYLLSLAPGANEYPASLVWA